MIVKKVVKVLEKLQGRLEKQRDDTEEKFYSEILRRFNEMKK